MRHFLVAVGLVLLPAVAGADRILLENGKSFDDVVLVSQTVDQVRFRVASGEMSLPSSWVTRVEKASGALEQYLRRQRSLEADPSASADAYLALARWARAQELNHGFRESLLTAAELEPKLEGLPPLMARIDYHFDSGSGIWVRGRPTSSARKRPHHPEQSKPHRAETGYAEGSNQRVSEGLTRAIETLAQAELERSRVRERRAERSVQASRSVGRAYYPRYPVSLGFASSGWVFRGAPLRSPDSDPSNPVVRKPLNREARALLARPPGSILPVSAYRH